MAPALPQPRLMFAANLFSTIAAVHLAFCHQWVIACVHSEAITDVCTEYMGMGNFHWTVMSFWWFLCFVLLIAWTRKNGDGTALAGNVVKLVASLCFLYQCWRGPADGFFSSLAGITFFVIGNLIHTLGFTRVFGVCHSTTIGILALTAGSLLLLIFFHLAVTYANTKVFWTKDGMNHLWFQNCMLLVSIGDGLLIVGSVILLVPAMLILTGEAGGSSARDGLCREGELIV